MSTKYFVKTRLRHLANQTLGRLPVASSELKPSIMLFSNRRGGSTWLIELLSEEPKTKRLVEVFDVTLNYNPYRSSLPEATEGFFVDLSRDEQSQLFSYFDDLVTGKKVYNTQWKFWKHPYSAFYDRLIFKIFYAKNYMYEFSQAYRSDVLLQLRHPIPTAMSISRLGWPSAFPAFLRKDGFRQLLSSDQITVLDEVNSRGSDLERHIAGWLLENLVPIRDAARSNATVLRYEDMVRNPEATVQLLSDKLALNCSEQVLETYRKPSYNAFDSASRIKSSSAEELCEGWRARFKEASNPLAKDLLRAFDTGHYTFD